MIHYYQFKSNVNRLAEELTWTRNLAVSTGGEIDFFIDQKRNKLICKRTTDEPFSFNGGNASFSLSHISKITFQGKPIKNIFLSFTHAGYYGVTGDLQLISDDEQTIYSIHFPPEAHKPILAKKT